MADQRRGGIDYRLPGNEVHRYIKIRGEFVIRDGWNEAISARRVGLDGHRTIQRPTIVAGRRVHRAVRPENNYNSRQRNEL